IVTGGGTGTAGGAIPPGAAATGGVAGATPGWLIAWGATRAAVGATVTVCVPVAGPGSVGCGNPGSAEAGGPAKPMTPATPAATPEARTPQRRAISFIDGDPSSAARGSSDPWSGADCIQPDATATRAGI